MRRWCSLSYALLFAGLSLTACADDRTTAMRAVGPAHRDAIAGEDPDSGLTWVYASDGVDGIDAGRSSRVATRSAFGIQAVASSPGPDIRIGVVQSAATLALGSADAFEVKDKATGLVLLTGANSAVTVTLAEKPPATFYRLQVVCGTTAAVAERKAAAEALGHPTFTEFVPSANCTRLYLGQYPPPSAGNTFAVRNAFRNLVISQGLAGTDSFWREVGVAATTVYRVTSASAVSESVNPIVVTSPSDLVTINGVTYRGRAEARFNGLSALAGINQLPLEHYLYGVVPRELGPVQYPEVEAQKAQAVAARTYAIVGFGKRASNGYDLRATTDDQVYGGYSAEHPVSNAAVDATNLIAAYYNGTLISTLYSSTSGGHTADNEEAFAGAAVPYLRGVPDAERGNALDHVPSLAVFKAHANPKSLRASREGDFESDWARFHRWTFEWTMSEISSVLAASTAAAITRVDAINVLERGPSGRVLAIEYVTNAGTFTATKDGIRASLKYINADGVPSNLLSTLFYIEPIDDPRTKTVSGYRVYGGGFGHGVGLSQTGAVGMAQKGHSFAEILKHYYRGIALCVYGQPCSAP